MSPQKLKIRRTELIQRIAQQRDDIALLARSFERPLGFVDKGYTLMQKLKQQPKLVFASTLVFAVLLRKRIFRKGATLLAIVEWYILKKK